MNVASALRVALVGDSAITALLPVYESDFPVFTRRPAPVDVTFPIIMISPDVMIGNEDGVNDDRPLIVRDVTTYGSNENAGNYRAVEAIAYAVQELFHRKRNSITVAGWSVTDIVANGPISVPDDDEQRIGRMVELTIRLARKN